MFAKVLHTLFRRRRSTPHGTGAGERLRARPSVEPLEERALLNAKWGVNGPPLVIDTAAVKARSITLNANGDAAGKAGIRKSEVDYYRFTPRTDGFYRLIARASFDAIVGVYEGATGHLLGYADNNYSGNEKFTAYLEGGQTYYLAVSNYRRSPGGRYKWRIDDVDVVSSLSAPSAGSGSAKHKLYLNFDGAFLRPGDLRSWDDDWQYGTAAEFDPRGDGVAVSPLLEYRGDRETIIARIIDHVQEDLAPFGVKVVRLPAGASAVAGVGATTVFLGPATLEDKGMNNSRRELFHVAGDIDVGNDNRTDIAFVSDEDWGSASRTALALADVVLHEAGHTFGLFHVQSGNHAESMGLRYSLDDSEDWVRDTEFLNRSFRYSEAYGSQDSYQIVATAFAAGGTLQPLTVSASTANLASAAALSWRAEERLLYAGPFRHDDFGRHEHHDDNHGHQQHARGWHGWYALDVFRDSPRTTKQVQPHLSPRRRFEMRIDMHLWRRPLNSHKSGAVRPVLPRDQVFASLDWEDVLPWQLSKQLGAEMRSR